MQRTGPAMWRLRCSDEAYASGTISDSSSASAAEIISALFDMGWLRYYGFMLTRRRADVGVSPFARRTLTPAPPIVLQECSSAKARSTEGKPAAKPVRPPPRSVAEVEADWNERVGKVEVEGE
eukprot:870131-Prymnesium_polylepis.1